MGKKERRDISIRFLCFILQHFLHWCNINIKKLMISFQRDDRDSSVHRQMSARTGRTLHTTHTWDDGPPTLLSFTGALLTPCTHVLNLSRLHHRAVHKTHFVYLMPNNGVSLELSGFLWETRNCRIVCVCVGHTGLALQQCKVCYSSSCPSLSPNGIVFSPLDPGAGVFVVSHVFNPPGPGLFWLFWLLSVVRRMKPTQNLLSGPEGLFWYLNVLLCSVRSTVLKATTSFYRDMTWSDLSVHSATDWSPKVKGGAARRGREVNKGGLLGQLTAERFQRRCGGSASISHSPTDAYVWILLHTGHLPEPASPMNEPVCFWSFVRQRCDSCSGRSF